MTIVWDLGIEACNLARWTLARLPLPRPPTPYRPRPPDWTWYQYCRGDYFKQDYHNGQETA